MIVTDAYVIRLVNISAADRSKLLIAGNVVAIIKKCKELMDQSKDDIDLNNKIDELIGQCSLIELKERLGDAVELVD